MMATGGGGSIAAAGGQAIGAIQAASGLIEKISAKKQMKRLRGMRRAFRTPDEVYDILHATQSRAQEGYDPTTLSYLTNQSDRAFSSTMGGMLRMGGDPNDAASLFDQKMQSMFRIGAESQHLNMQNFNKYINAVQLVAQNKETEWASEQSMLKDDMQAQGKRIEDANKNLQSGLNAMIGSQAAHETSDLYREDARGGNGGVAAPVYYRPGGSTVAPPITSINPAGLNQMVNRKLEIPSWLLNKLG
jgi:hypothetical protein